MIDGRRITKRDIIVNYSRETQGGIFFCGIESEMLLLSSRIDKNTLQGRIFCPMAKYSVTRIESLENILKSTISSRHLLIFLI